tara:strand:- start:724 stop:906 length:183 start_codon:yes stop_codon:yes gene_type:complete
MLLGPNARKSQEQTPQLENLYLKGTRHIAWNVLTDSTDATKLIDDERASNMKHKHKKNCA